MRTFAIKLTAHHIFSDIFSQSVKQKKGNSCNVESEDYYATLYDNSNGWLTLITTKPIINVK